VIPRPQHRPAEPFSYDARQKHAAGPQMRVVDHVGDGVDLTEISLRHWRVSMMMSLGSR